MTLWQLDVQPDDRPEALRRLVADLAERLEIGLLAGLGQPGALDDVVARDPLASAAVEAARLAPERWRRRVEARPVDLDERALLGGSPAQVAQRYGYLEDLEVDPDWYDERRPGLEAPLGQAPAVALRITEVTCRRSAAWWGDADLAVGGTWIGPGESGGMVAGGAAGPPADGQPSRVQPLVLVERPLGTRYPQTVSALVVLAETDWGGFGAFLETLYAAVRAYLDEILVVLGAAAGSAFGTQVGGAVGGLIAGPPGLVVGIAAGFVLGAVVAFLAHELGDVILPPFETFVTVTSAPTGGLVTAGRRDIAFEGADYTVSFEWVARA